MLPPGSEKRIHVSLSISGKHKRGKKNTDTHGKENKNVSWYKHAGKTLKYFRAALRRIYSISPQLKKKTRIPFIFQPSGSCLLTGLAVILCGSPASARAGLVASTTFGRERNGERLETQLQGSIQIEGSILPFKGFYALQRLKQWP